MGQLLNSGQVGNTGLKQMKQIKEQTINKWDNLGFLDGLEGHLKENIAQLYENQASYLINEATSADSSGSFETVVFPIVRRVFSKLLANDIVSVQALNMPIGRLYYFVPKVSSRKSDGSHHDIDHFPGDSTDTKFDDRNLYDSFYEDQDDPLFDRSKGNYDTITGGTVDSYKFDGNSLVQDNYDGTTRYMIVKLSGFNSTNAGQLTGPDGNEMDTEEFLASLKIKTDQQITASTDSGNRVVYDADEAVEFRVVTQKYGQGIVQYGDICDANGEIFLELDFSTPACIECDTADNDGYQGSELDGTETFSSEWRRYQSLEFEDKLGEVSFDLDFVTVSVTERKLRAQWSPEIAQDVSAFHNIDAEAELTALLSEQIAAEIDREILRDLRKGAAWTLRWDYHGWKRKKQGTTVYTQKDWNQTLITAINQISAQIHKSTLRGGANWIVVSAEISAIFNDLEYFHVSNAAPEQDQYNMGIERVGTLQNRYTVYRDPYFPADKILIGHKGTSLLDTGYIYAPYVPLQLTPTMYNPFTFSPIKGIMTRYAKKMVNNRFYGTIKCDGIQTFDIRELR